jgi:hypothetical protein
MLNDKLINAMQTFQHCKRNQIIPVLHITNNLNFSQPLKLLKSFFSFFVHSFVHSLFEHISQQTQPEIVALLDTRSRRDNREEPQKMIFLLFLNFF